MLWSDPRDEPDEETRAARTKLERLYWVLPVVVAVVMLLLHASNV
ncbi:hypothetical protein GCM10009801_28150 [Streptomyces albiaxialis]|uniref:Uncharacterized protein n=1 Tax=Streptomyces albiaxialis TaxID=329523 RepID=A0ABN2VVU1_9ACTN